MPPPSSTGLRPVALPAAKHTTTRKGHARPPLCVAAPLPLCVVALLCLAAPTWSQPSGPPRPPGGVYNPYQPLLRQGPLPDAVQQALQGILLFPGQEAAAIPGAVHLKPPVALSPLLPVTPAGVAPSPVLPATPAAVDQRSVLYLTRLQAGDHAPEVREWLRGLPMAQVISLLEKTPWRKDDHAVCDALVQTLLTTHHLNPAKADDLSPLCALRVAQSLGAQGDRRCEPVFERLLDQQRDNEALAVPAVLAFAEYYRFVGDYAKSAETFLRAEDYTDEKPTVANCTVEAARAYMQAGNDAEAERLYAEVPKYGYGWATGAAVLDWAGLLTRKGQHEEAREVLRRPVTGRYSDQIRVALLQYLGYSFYLAGDFGAAQAYSRQAIAQYVSLSDPLKGEGLDTARNAAEACLRWVSLWQRSPLRVVPDCLHLAAEVGDDMSSGVFVVETHRSLPLRFESDCPGVRAEVEGVVNHPFCTRHHVRVNAHIQPGRATATVVITTPEHAPGRATLRVSMEGERRIRWNPGRVFFGFIRPGERAEVVVRATGPAGLQLTRITCEAPWLEASASVSESTDTRAEWVIRVCARKDSLPAGACANGVVRVRTDLPGEEVMVLPCYAHVLRERPD